MAGGPSSGPSMVTAFAQLRGSRSPLRSQPGRRCLSHLKQSRTSRDELCSQPRSGAPSHSACPTPSAPSARPRPLADARGHSASPLAASRRGCSRGPPPPAHSHAICLPTPHLITFPLAILGPANHRATSLSDLRDGAGLLASGRAEGKKTLYLTLPTSYPMG